MAEETVEKKGASAFMDRLNETIDEIAAGKEFEAPGTEEPGEPEKAAPEDKLDELVPDETPAPVSDDPLDNLEPEPSPEEKEDKREVKAPEEGTDFLAQFDEDEKKQIQAFVDEQIASEVTVGESAGGAFKRLRAENRELKQQLEGAGGEESSEALSAATKRIEELESLVKAQEETDKIVNLEQTDAWQKEIITPLQDILVESDTIAERYGVDKEALSDVLQITDPRQLSEAMARVFEDADADILEADKFTLYGLAKKVDAVYTHRDVLRNNAEKALEEANRLVAEQREHEALEHRQTREQAAKLVRGNIMEKAKFVADIMGDEAMNAAEKAIAEGSISTNDLAFSQFAAKAFAPMARKIRALENELESVSDELSARKSATPGAGGGTATEEAAATGEDEGLTFAQRMEKGFSHLGL